MSLTLYHTHGVNLKKRLITFIAALTQTLTRKWQTSQPHEANARIPRALRNKSYQFHRGTSLGRITNHICPAHHTLTFHFLRSLSKSFRSIHFCFPSFLGFHSCKPKFVFFLTDRATNTVHLKFFNSLTLIFNSLITLTSSNLLTIPTFTCKILPITLFSDNYNLYSTLRSRQVVWRPYRTANRPTVVLISSHPASSDIFQY